MKAKNKEDKLRAALMDIGIVPIRVCWQATFGFQPGGWFFDAMAKGDDDDEDLYETEFYLGRDYKTAVQNITNKNIITGDQYWRR